MKQQSFNLPGVTVTSKPLTKKKAMAKKTRQRKRIADSRAQAQMDERLDYLINGTD